LGIDRAANLAAGEGMTAALYFTVKIDGGSNRKEACGHDRDVAFQRRDKNPQWLFMFNV